MYAASVPGADMQSMMLRMGMAASPNSRLREICEELWTVMSSHCTTNPKWKSVLGG